jgi:hypothetical protein
MARNTEQPNALTKCGAGVVLCAVGAIGLGVERLWGELQNGELGERGDEVSGLEERSE